MIDYDDAIVRWVSQHRSTWMCQVARDLSAFASAAWLVLAFAVSIRRPQYCALRFAAAVGAIAWACDELIKRVVCRLRPDPGYSDLGVLFETGYSFPSGHATVGMAFWLTLGLCRRDLLPACAAVPILIGVSRVVLGVHFPTDVLGGWALGAAVAITCKWGADKWPRSPGR